jgi:nucleotide-binding universal stress UspA family protein
VLVPLDGSGPADAALAQAVPVAQAFGAVLDLVQVVPWAMAQYATSMESYVSPELEEQLEQSAEEYLRGVAATLPEGVAAEWHVRRGSPVQGIFDHLESTGAGLVVMGTHGRSGIGRFLLGSVAERVVHTAEVPVLLVRAGEAASE